MSDWDSGGYWQEEENGRATWVEEAAPPVTECVWSQLQDPLSWGETKEETKMQKEYEYKVTGKGGVGPYDIYKYDPCDTEFGKFAKWFYGLPSPPSSVELVAKLVEQKRFGWLDWLAEHTPFVTRTEKK